MSTSSASTSSRSASSTSSTHARTPSPPRGYFHGFAGYNPTPRIGFEEQFSRLAINQGWSKKEKKRRRPEAIEEEFNDLQTTDTNKLARWQALCVQVGIEEVPNSITKCKKALGSPKVMVNLTNLIDHMKLGTPLIKFKNFAEFRNYTLKPQNMFPRDRAKKEGFIKALLRHVV
ncbi:hypothetical protein CC80DRAFT_465055 [Byssothecium circinans]|uniref:Uncharacterized protein n=1 Tax=Byssothecium circinans TaxID=147558 RepID=A0A6A5UA99_9PLEO|nr:hypothetical protein CC80DRAFT_465055 [Byssothecium circinans]